MSPEALARALAHVRRAKKAQLPSLWSEYLAEPCPAGPILRRHGLAWRLQAHMHGGLAPATRRRIQELMQSYARDPEYRPPGVAPLKPGTEFVRHWRGSVHRVRVTTGGYEYQGEIYPSLSVIARRITGTRWSGPQFFGVRSSEGSR